MTKIPVNIITGFLGTGKTTFLNHFIKERLAERIFVIENECGATNVDGALIMEGVEEVVELSAGCLCCSLADGLLDALAEAHKQRDRYDRLVIETTGIADPTSIVEVFLANSLVEKYFELEQVVCLVDAGLVEDWLDETEEALQQIVSADVLLVNKADTVTPAYLMEVKKQLKDINPNAQVFGGIKGMFPIDQILKIGTVKPESVEAISHQHQNHNHHIHNHDHQVVNNSHKITTFTLTFSHPLDFNELQLDLNRIVHLYRHQVYRVKGFLQSARSTVIATDGTPWKDADNREGKLVFIGRGLKKEIFEKMFNRHLIA
uniref:CobW family GTP-binding protein n=1 Tax=Fulvivirga sp. TaxID=1931237 RepID=UPI004049AB42